jgi:hypothetical protein
MAKRKKKRTSEQHERLRALARPWSEHRAEMERMYERWLARMDAIDAREERRRARLRRLTFGLLGR